MGVCKRCTAAEAPSEELLALTPAKGNVLHQRCLRSQRRALYQKRHGLAEHCIGSQFCSFPCT